MEQGRNRRGKKEREQRGVPCSVAWKKDEFFGVVYVLSTSRGAFGCFGFGFSPTLWNKPKETRVLVKDFIFALSLFSVTGSIPSGSQIRVFMSIWFIKSLLNLIRILVAKILSKQFIFSLTKVICLPVFKTDYEPKSIVSGNIRRLTESWACEIL